MTAHAWGIVGLVIGSPVSALLGVLYIRETIRGSSAPHDREDRP